MNNKVKTIGVLTSGGDAPGMNAAIRAVVRSALYRGIKVIGIRRGWTGLINGDAFEMSNHDVDHIINKGGTILYTARSDEFMTKEGRKKAYNTCKLFGIEALVAIGGDGTFAGCLDFSNEYDVAVVGIPATIDNDIGSTHYTIGYDTAANTSIDAIDKICDTMASHERCSVIEVMGHRSGNLALYVGIATGATAVLIPEIPWDFKRDVADKIRSARLSGKTHYMILVAEGATRKEGEDNTQPTNVSAARLVANEIEKEFELDQRISVLGYIQRGGSPSARDRVTATRMGYLAVKILAEGKSNRVIVTKQGKTFDEDMSDALKMKKNINPYDAEVLKAMLEAK